MTVEMSDYGRIKVILNHKDLKGLGINFKTLCNPSTETRLILKAIFKIATERLGQNLTFNHTLFEAYPHLNGGGVFYFTPLALDKKNQIQIKSNRFFYACDFYDGGNLLTALEQLYLNPLTRNTPSKIYDLDGFFRLVIADAHSIVYEFSDGVLPFTKIKKYTCEHGRALTGDNAIYEIGQKLIAPSNPLPPT